MCGRYTLSESMAELEDFFDLFRPPQFSPRYNIAPTQTVLAIRVSDDRQRVADGLQWGLIPPWADSAAIGSQLINARSESAATKPAFRRAFRERRCLIPATGFYEWQAVGKTKQPWHLSLKSGDPLAFAGLWETWSSPNGPVIESCTILTTAANEFLSDFHQRMPVVLNRETWGVWLDPDVQEPEVLLPLMIPNAADLWQRVPVSSLVNSVKNDSPDCVKPVRAPRGLFDGLE